MTNDIILRARGITKVFPGTIALNNVDFNVYHGKVNVLVGENGAGKSTLMKILAGVEQPTKGEILLENRPVHFKSTHDASAYGIGMIFQELNLFPNLNVSENIHIANEITKAKVFIDHKTQDIKTIELLKRLEHEIDPHELISNLRIGQQQIVEIAKALSLENNILIMDEPTSALSNEEVDILFKVIEDLKSHGVSIIYISHRLEELLKIGDYITVLKDGKLIEESKIDLIDIPWIITKMTGSATSAAYDHKTVKLGEELLKVEALTLPRLGGGYTLDNFSFNLKKGEILGLYGLMGAGRTELFECLMGIHKEASGNIWIDGKSIMGYSIRKRIKSGIALIPEDRQREGLVQTLSVAHNLTLSSLESASKYFHIIRKKEYENINRIIKELSVKVAYPDIIISSLSGGNQQKIVIGKALLTAPKVLLMDEPTRGIDVAAKSDVFKIINLLASKGFGIIIITTELKEILAISDRVIVLSKGKKTGEFLRKDATEESLVKASAVGHEIKH